MFRYDFDGRKRLASETLSACIITQRYTEVAAEKTAVASSCSLQLQSRLFLSYIE